MKKGQESVKNEIIEKIRLLGEEVRNSDNTLETKTNQVDVLLDTIRFLENYDENVQVLNRYWIKKYRESKFKER